MDIPILQYPTYLEQVSVALLSVFSAAQLEYFKNISPACSRQPIRRLRESTGYMC